MLRNLSDQDLLEMLDSKQSDMVFAEFYRRYSHMVYGVCLKYFNSRDESLDAVTEIFEILMSKLHLHVITNFSSWLYSVTKNHCLMKLRKEKREQLALGNIQIYESENVETDEPESEHHQKLAAAIECLPSEQKTCIVLFYFNRKSYTEIAGETGYSVKMVKSHLQNGRIKLKKLIKKNYE